MSPGAAKPLLEVKLDAPGAVLLLETPAVHPATISLRDWDLLLEKGRALVILRAREASPPERTNILDDERIAKMRGAVERGLDILAANGGGAYRLCAPWDRAVYWWPAEAALSMCAFGTLDLPFPWGMNVTDTRRPSEVAGRTANPQWSPAFRFFRLAQTARDPYAAFRDTYLAVEHLLSQASPVREGEKERPWLERALREFNDRRPRFEEKTWLDSLDLGQFANTVYKSARHPAFHAKEGRPFFIPLDPQAELEVHEALVPLTKMFLELAAEVLHWPLNERPQIEATLAQGGEWLGRLDAVPFCQAESPGKEPTFPKSAQRLELDPSGTTSMSFGGDALRELPYFDGWYIALNGQATPEELPYRLPMAPFNQIELRFKPRVRFSGLIRTSF